MIIKEKRRYSNFDHYLFLILAAFECLMAFTFLGYIHVPPISIAIAYIPILVAASLWGPIQSTIIGVIFGLSSMFKASASYVMPADMIFSPFRSGAPVSSLILSVGTRAFFGFLIGIIFLAARNRKHPYIWKAVIAAFGTKLHTICVFTAMGWLFPEFGYNYKTAFTMSLGEIALVFLCIASVLIANAIYDSKTIKHFKISIEKSKHNPYMTKRANIFFCIFELFCFGMAISATGYFSQRTAYMLSQHGIEVSNTINGDVLHLQIQFLIATLSLNVISVVLLICIYRYMAYRQYRGELDGLTEVMGRRMFLYYCDKIQNDRKSSLAKRGWFLLIDVDYFKSINDTFGHPIGDKVLSHIATSLKDAFDKEGTVGRVGGDEFALIVEVEMTRKQLEKKLDAFLEEIGELLPDRKVSCSMGVYNFEVPTETPKLLQESDRALYQAKEKGRGCYVMR